MITMILSFISVFDLLNFIIQVITAICATYLAWAVLRHSTKPRAIVYFTEPQTARINETKLFKFPFKNIGYWYAKPIIVNMTVFVNFEPTFELKEIRYGSVQEIIDNNVRDGKGGMKFLKAKGIKLGFSEFIEEVHVLAKCPSEPGMYRIKIDAYSDNGLDYSESFSFEVTD